MSPEEIDALASAVAERVVEQLRDEQAAPTSNPDLVDAATLARALGVSTGFVYSRSSELGARRLGDGPRARLRFDLAEAVKAHTKREPESAAPSLKPRRGALDGRPRAASCCRSAEAGRERRLLAVTEQLSNEQEPHD